MTDATDVAERRKKQQGKIRIMLNSLKAGEIASMKGGEDTVAWIKEELCIGCDPVSYTHLTLPTILHV